MRKVTGFEKKVAEFHDTNEVFRSLPKPFQIAAVVTFAILIVLVIVTYVLVLTDPSVGKL